MTGWTAKRFWKETAVKPEGEGWSVRLDNRPLKTPAKAPLLLPTAAMAEAVAAEWQAQDGKIRPETMPVTRAANSAIDKVAQQFDAVVALIADYGGTDLLCYRAEAPAALVARQADAWEPLLAWAAADLSAPLVVTHGVVPVPQPAESLARLHAAVAAHDPFALAALHDLVMIPGSLIIGLAVVRGRLTAAQGWAASRIDEVWQSEQWGVDAEAEALEASKQAAMADAERFLLLCRAVPA